MLLRHATSSIAQWLAALGPAATKSLRRLRRDRRGSVAILFALAAVMVFTAVGAAVDYSHITKTRTEMLNACDAGLLAAMRQLQLDGPPAASTGGGTLPGTGAGTTKDDRNRNGHRHNRRRQHPQRQRGRALTRTSRPMCSRAICAMTPRRPARASP